MGLIRGSSRINVKKPAPVLESVNNDTIVTEHNHASADTHGGSVRTAGATSSTTSHSYMHAVSGKELVSAQAETTYTNLTSPTQVTNQSYYGVPTASTGYVAPPAAAPVISVSNAAGLMTALQNAKGGEKIVLQAGDYGSLSLWSGAKIPASYASMVTITSADPLNQAKITGLKANGIGNVTFDNITFKYDAPPGAPNASTPFAVKECSNIVFSGSHFIGDKAEGLDSISNGYGTGIALSVRNCSAITVKDNTFEGFYRGGAFGSIDKLTLSGNDISGMASDGLNFAAVKDTLIQGNHIHDFARSPLSAAHPDMIQFWTQGTSTPSVNIVIKDNYLDQGSGQLTQSIFMRNEMVDSLGAGKEMYYQNVVIQNNVIVNGSSHGITVGESSNLLIDNNTILQRVTTQEGGGTVSVPKINISALATGVTVTDNVLPATKAALVAQPGWTVSNNVSVDRDNPESATFIGKLFSDALDRTDSSLADYQVLPGGILAVDSLGSSLTHDWMHLTSGKAAFISTSDASSGGFMIQKFDANHVFDKNGKIDLTGAKVVWDFGDGSSGTGLVADHVYSKAGNYEATATITLANNETIKVDKSVLVRSTDLLDVDFNGTLNDLSHTVNAVTATGATFEQGADGSAIRLNGGTVKYQSTSDFFSNDEYTLLVDFKKDAATPNVGGRLVYFSGVFVVTVGADCIEAAVTTTGGSKSIKVGGLNVNNADWHKLALSFSSDEGTATLYLDGKEIGSVDGLTGSIQTGATSSALTVGSPFGGSFVGLVDNLHYVADSLDAKHIAAPDPLQAWARDTISSNSVVSDYAVHSDAILPYGMSSTDVQEMIH